MKNSAIAYDKYYILTPDIEVTEFSHNSILSVFPTNRMKISHLLHSIDLVQYTKLILTAHEGNGGKLLSLGETQP